MFPPNILTTPAGYWLIAIAFLSIPLSIGIEEAARHFPLMLGWLLPEDSRIFPRSRYRVILSILLTTSAAIIWRASLEAAILAAIVTLILNYVSSIDQRSRWLPDHAVLPLLMIGILYSPVTSLQERVDGFVLCPIVMLGWLLFSGLVKHHPIGPDLISAGELKLAGAFGAWLGVSKGLYAIFIGIFLMTLVNAIAKPRDPKKNGFNAVQKFLGYDRDMNTIEDTFPAGMYFSLGFWIILMICAPPA